MTLKRRILTKRVTYLTPVKTRLDEQGLSRREWKAKRRTGRENFWTHATCDSRKNLYGSKHISSEKSDS